MIQKYIKKIFFCLIYTLSALSFFGGNLYAEDDLLRQIMQPAVEDTQSVINVGKSAQSVGNRVIKGSLEIDGEGIGGSSSIILKITRFLLILTITLSVTMILYNGMIYIIQTGQGKEGKSLIKNVALIVVGILVSLFSVIIINLIQSIPTTLDQELKNDNTTDTKFIKGKKIKRGHEMSLAIRDVFNKYKYGDFNEEECNSFKEHEYFMYEKYCITPL